MAAQFQGDWRRAIVFTPRSRVHLWVNDRANGFPIQGFALPVCNVVLKWRSTSPIQLGSVATTDLCYKCLTWYERNPGRA